MANDLDDVLAAAISERESDPDFDLEQFLIPYPDVADRVRARLEKLGAAGILSSRPRGEGGSASELLTPKGAFEARFEIERELGRGGMGRVLRVFDRELGRRVAMKQLRRDRWRAAGPELRRRFMTEARITARLEHPAIPPIFEIGDDASIGLYYTMRLIDGRDFSQVIRSVHRGEGDWSKIRAMGVVLQACEAVSHAHSHGVLHRDIKPANVMVGTQGEVYVVDWGISKSLAIEEAGGQDAKDTARGRVLGTPMYMAPEQARGATDEIDARTDVYGLGAMLYELLTGEPPFGEHRESTPDELRERVVAGLEPRPVEQVAKKEPPALLAICSRAMARDPDERYPDVASLAADLRAFQEGRVVRAYRTGAWAEVCSWTRRNPVVAGLTLAFTLGVAGGGVAYGLKVVEGLDLQARIKAAYSILGEHRLDELENFETRGGDDRAADSARYLKASREALDLLAEWGVPLDGSRTEDEIRTRHAALDPDRQETVFRALYDVLRFVGNSAAGPVAAYRRVGGTLPASPDNWEFITRTHSQWIEPWQRAIEYLVTVAPEATGTRAALAWEGKLVGKDAELALPSWADQTSSSEASFSIYVYRRIEGDEAALASALDALQRFPRNYGLAYTASRMCFRTGRMEEAEDWARVALVLRPDSFNARSLSAVLREAAGNLSEAIEAMIALVGDYPEDRNATFNLAAMLLERDEEGDPSEARGWLEHCLEIDPNDLDTLRLLWSLAYNDGVAGDRKSLDRAVELGERRSSLETTGDAQWRLAQTYVALGESARADEIIEEAIQRFPHDADLVLGWLETLWDEERFEEWVEFGVRWLETHPGHRGVLDAFQAGVRDLPDADLRAACEEFLKADF